MGLLKPSGHPRRRGTNVLTRRRVLNSVDDDPIRRGNEVARERIRGWPGYATVLGYSSILVFTVQKETIDDRTRDSVIMLTKIPVHIPSQVRYDRADKSYGKPLEATARLGAQLPSRYHYAAPLVGFHHSNKLALSDSWDQTTTNTYSKRHAKRHASEVLWLG